VAYFGGRGQLWQRRRGHGPRHPRHVAVAHRLHRGRRLLVHDLLAGYVGDVRERVA